jgi:hypothetical protein
VISWLFSPWLSPATFRAFLVLPPAKGVEVDHAPELSPMARTAPGQTAGAAPQEGDQPSQRARPLCHAGGLERRPALPEASLLAKTVRATIRDPSADRHDVASLVADIDHLGVEQGLRSQQPRLRLAAHFPTTQGTIHDTHELEQRRSVGLPSIRQKQGKLAGPRDDLRDQRGCRVLRAWSKVDPEQHQLPWQGMGHKIPVRASFAILLTNGVGFIRNK